MKSLFADIFGTPQELNIPTTPANAATLQDILSVVFATLGAICVLVVIIAGIRFMLAQGDPGKISSARSTIIYALVGLVVSMMAFVIVGFVLGNTG